MVLPRVSCHKPCFSKTFVVQQHLRSQRTFSTKSHGSEKQTHVTKNSSAQQSQDVDVLIVGGGLVGSALACALGSTKFTSTQKVTLIDGGGFPPAVTQSHPELRVISINNATAKLFQAVGIWKDLQNSGRLAPFHNMEVWDSKGPAAIHFSNNNHELGTIVENNLIQYALYKRLSDFPNVNLMTNTHVESIQYPELNDNNIQDDRVKVTTKDGKVFTTKLLVGADGGDSFVRKSAQIPTTGWSYHQRGVVCVMEHAEPNKTAWQRFLPEGPIALLPMFNNYSSIVWSVSNTKCDVLLSLPDEVFAEEVNNAFHGTIKTESGFVWADMLSNYVPAPGFLGSNVPNPPRIQKIVGKKAAFPFGTKHAKLYVKPRLALVGDAAHTVHPLAGQGVNLGFADVAGLTNTIIRSLESGQDIGSLSMLQSYQNERMLNNTVMMMGIDSIKSLFASNFFPVTLARNIGLTITNSLSPVKNEIVNFAMGGQVDVSRIGSNTS